MRKMQNNLGPLFVMVNKAIVIYTRVKLDIEQTNNNLHIMALNMITGSNLDLLRALWWQGCFCSMHKSTLNSLELVSVWLGLIEEFLHDKLRSKCIFISVPRAAGRPMDVILVWFLKSFLRMMWWVHIVLCPLLTWKCLSSIPLVVSLFPPFSLHCLCALWMCRMLVPGIFRHLKAAQGRTTPKKIQSFFCFFFPLAASLDTSWHDHLIKESSGVTKCAYCMLMHTHTEIHEDMQFMHKHIPVHKRYT